VSVHPIIPARGPVCGTVRVPGSKSLTNRALVLGALAEGRTVVEGALASDDTLRMAAGLRALGFAVEDDRAAGRFVVPGEGGRIPAPVARVDAGDAGTVARFLTAVAALGFGEYVVDGSPRMRRRPIADLVEALRQLGADAVAPTGCPPVTVRARGLGGGRATVPGGTSSQFLSALLHVAPLAGGPVELLVPGSQAAAPFVAMTLGAMRAFGVTASEEGGFRYRITPQRYTPRTFAVEPDASGASYFFAAAAATGGRVTVAGLRRGSLQGDVRFLDVLEGMGCTVRWTEHGVTVQGPEHLRGMDVDLRAMPDVTATLAALAPFAEGVVRIRGVGYIRHHESDRLAALAEELRRLGQDVRDLEDGLEITPRPVRSAVVQTHNDHRLAMAFAVTGLRAPGIAIASPEVVSKTFPDFFERLDELRAGAD